MIGCSVGLVILSAGLAPCGGQVRASKDDSNAVETSDLPDRPSFSDSSKVYQIGEILVTAPTPGIVAEPGRTEVSGTAIGGRDGGSAESLAPLVPSTRVGVNSRGEAIFTIRGASERQIGLFHDGMPLTIPWDERVDASLVPAEALGTVRVVRGVGSVLEGPNTLAGVIHLISLDLDPNSKATRLTLQGGEARALRGNLFHGRRSNQWSLLSSINHQSRDGFLLPKDFESDHNQTQSRRRTNSDLRQDSFLLRLTRRFADRGAVAVSAIGVDAHKGVPPETHLEDARFWKIPTWRRLLLGVQGELLPDDARRYRIDSGLSLDLFRQEIQQYPDIEYAADPESLAAMREEGNDLTGTWRLRASRRTGGRGSLAGAVTLRATRHRETLEEGGPLFEYTQLLTGGGIEWEGPVSRSFRLRAGMGLDLARTPDSGDKPRRENDHAPVVGLRLSWELTENGQLHLKAGRRTRFPSLRELYSGALGKFEPNPELGPESLEAIELGGGWRGGKAEVALDGFAQLLRDGIVRTRLDTGKLQRRNEEKIRTLGVELAGNVRLRGRLRIHAHHTFLHARSERDGAFRDRVEGPATFLSYLTVSDAWSLDGLLAGTVKGSIEGIFTGERWSLDADIGTLRLLAPTAAWNARLAWIARPSRFRGEFYLRVNNLLDSIVYSQVGLPEAGRELVGGLRVDF